MVLAPDIDSVALTHYLGRARRRTTKRRRASDYSMGESNVSVVAFFRVRCAHSSDPAPATQCNERAEGVEWPFAMP